MNIVFLTSSLGLGGAEKQLVAWAGILQRDLGARVSVACLDETRVDRLDRLRELDVPVVIAGRDYNALTRLERMVSFARKSRADVVHAFNYYLSTPAILAAMAAGAIPASSFQGDGLADLEDLGPLRRLPALKIIRYFTSNSREAMARLEPRLRPRALLQYVPNVVTPPDPELFKPRRADDRHDPVALVVARLDDNKRVNVFLEALAAARQLEPRLTGVIVGDGPARDSLSDLASRLGLSSEGVRFAGQLPDATESFANADIFVHLALSEGTPNVVLEAMAMGLPVVATAAGDVRRIIQSGLNGLLVPFDDAAAVAGHLVDLVRNPELRSRLGEQARLGVIESYSAKQVSDSLQRFYSAVGTR